MRRWSVNLICALAWASAPSTLAQPAPRSAPTESVTVTAPGTVPEQAAHDFVKSFTGVSPASGKIARWRLGVCPVVTGLPPSGNTLVSARVRQVAALAGAPVGDTSCKPNTDIVFTLNPQVLLDGIRAKDRVLLGYHDPAQEKELATVRHPVQAWYVTQSVDLNGTTYIDDKLRNHGGFYIQVAPGSFVFVPDARVTHVTGSHLSDGVSSELNHAVIVIDLAKVTGLTVGALTDYVAMLALSQTQSFETCAPMASITNLVSAQCDVAVKPDEITSADLSYLHGLYSVDPRASLMRQKEEIAARMEQGAGQ
ncbi:MAG: hypothetical protein H0U98_16435 [Alphaproteobacteria bacterium]|nr:hypothetical protein [Alphaproteobacteria bacterium]